MPKFNAKLICKQTTYCSSLVFRVIATLHNLVVVKCCKVLWVPRLCNQFIPPFGIINSSKNITSHESITIFVHVYWGIDYTTLILVVT